MHLDTVDCRLLKELQADARVSNLKLAERVALSPSACLRRVQLLEKEGFIAGYHAHLSAGKLGYEIEAIVQVSLDGSRPKWHDAFLRAIALMPEITKAWVVAGDCNFLLQVRARKLKDFSYFIVEKLSRLEGMRDTRSFLILKEIKDSPFLETEIPFLG